MIAEGRVSNIRRLGRVMFITITRDDDTEIDAFFNQTRLEDDMPTRLIDAESRIRVVGRHYITRSGVHTITVETYDVLT